MSNNARHDPPAMYQLSMVEVLYEHGEPLLFVGKVGFCNALFIKVDEIDDLSKYLSCYIDGDHLNGLKEGRISIRGVFDRQAEKHFVYADEDLMVFEEHAVVDDDISEDDLPMRNIGLYPRFGECPDTLQDSDAFLTVYFKGAALNNKSIPYSVLMSLLGGVQSFARSLMLPEELRGTKSSTFDFMVGEPDFGSLMVSIKEPIFNTSRINQTEGFETLTEEDLSKQLNDKRGRFVSGVEDLIHTASQSDFRRQNAVGHVDHPKLESDVFDAVKTLLPTDGTAFSSVTFATPENGELRRISIDKDKADSFRRTFKEKSQPTARLQGVIIEINARSNSILLQTIGGVTTCGFDRDDFKELRANPLFKIGTQMTLVGELTERVRRDYLAVSEILELAIR